MEINTEISWRLGKWLFLGGTSNRLLFMFVIFISGWLSAWKRKQFASETIILFYQHGSSCSGVAMIKKKEKRTMGIWLLCAEGGRCLSRRWDGGIRPTFNHPCCLPLVFSQACFDGPVFLSFSTCFSLPTRTNLCNMVSWRDGREINVFLLLSVIDDKDYLKDRQRGDWEGAQT